METTLRQLEDNKVELTVNLGAEQVDAAVKDAYREGAQARIPGFRQGKAPRHVLDNYYGGKDYFLTQATDTLVKKTYPEALDDEELVLLDEVEFDELPPVEEGQPYCYKFTFSVAPKLSLSSYDPIQIELPSDDPTDAEVQTQLDVMMEYYVDYEDITDRDSQSGDVLHLELEVTRDGTPVDGLCGLDMPYELGVESMPADFEEHFMGVRAAAEMDFDFNLSAETRPALEPEAGANVDADGKPLPVVLHAHAKVLRVESRQVPELTDDWVKKTLEYDSVERFRELIADSLRVQKQGELPDLKEGRILDALAARLEGEVPTQMVLQIEKDIYRDVYSSLQKQGMTLDAYLKSNNLTPEGFRKDINKQASENARQAMALDAWATHAGIEVSDEEVLAEFTKSGADDPGAALETWRGSGRLPEVRQGIRRVKASERLADEAIVTVEKAVDAAADAADTTAADAAAAAAAADNLDPVETTDKPEKPDETN